MNTIVWFRIWFLTVTPFGLCLAFAVLLMNRVAMFSRQKNRALQRFHTTDCMWLAVPLGIAGAKLFHWAFSFGDYSFWQALALWRGGYAMDGAWMGFILGVFLYSRRQNVRLGDALDCFATALCLFVLIERLAEGFTDQGIGKGIDTAFLQHTFFSMSDEYGTRRHAVYRLEALSAAIALLFIIRMRFNSDRLHFRVRGEAFRMALLLLAAPQVVWESMRDDGYLVISFVRIQQWVPFLSLNGLFCFYFQHLRRTPVRRLCLIVHAIFVLCGVLVVRQEFAVDSDTNLELNYLIMTLGMIGFSACILKLRAEWMRLLRRTARRRKPPVPRQMQSVHINRPAVPQRSIGVQRTIKATNPTGEALRNRY